MVKMRKHTEKANGVSLFAILTPAILILIVIYGLLITHSIRINRIKDQLFAATNEYVVYSQASVDLQSTANALTDRALLYVETGAESYLHTYFNDAELQQRRQNAVESIRHGGNVTKEVGEMLSDSMNTSMEMQKMELTAMRLRAEADGVDISEYPLLAAHVLPDDLTGLSPDEARLAAHNLLIGDTYRNCKTHIYDAFSKTLSSMMAQTRERTNSLSDTLGKYTSIQNVYTMLLCFVLAVVFILLYIELFRPLFRITKSVLLGQNVSGQHGFREVHELSVAYNSLLNRQANMEEDLRHTAQVDALTNLPNRLAMINYTVALKRLPGSTSIAVLSFDVNGLKPANDTMGHLFGDKLLQSAAECILECFGDENGKNCFRTGGDEFVAILTGISEEEVKEKIAQFERIQEGHGVSIAVGYAFSGSIVGMSTNALFSRADSKMYRRKAEVKAAWNHADRAATAPSDQFPKGIS